MLCNPLSIEISSRYFTRIYVILGCAIVGSALLWAGGVAMAKVVMAGTNYVQREVFANYLAKDYDFFVRTHLGSLASQATRLRHAYNDYCARINSGVARQAVVIISSVVIIAWQSWLLALVTVALMSLLMAFIIVTMRQRLKFRYVVGAAHNETDGMLGDALGNAVTVKSFAAEQYEKNRLDVFFRKISQAQYRSWLSAVPQDVGRNFLTAVVTIVLLVLTAQLYEESSLSTAVVVLVQLYVIKLVMATAEVADLIRDYDDFMSSGYQAAKTMLIEPSIADPSPVKALGGKANGVLAFADVSFRYGETSESFALQNLSLTVRQGEKIGLVGYSGSGKTTLTKLLLRFMDADSGEITIDGVDISTIAQSELRKNIAYVPQEPLLFHRSMYENIVYGNPAAAEADVREAGRAAYVDEFIDQLPLGYQTLLGEKGIRLSGGQRQRVAIARAVLKDAPILVLDEATSALDSQSEKYIQKALWELMNGRTAVVIAHRLSTIMRMDRIVVLDQGRIAEIGTHEELLFREDGVYAKLWAHQSTATN
jgi:ATP-binding cassette subfamily B protein